MIFPFLSGLIPFFRAPITYLFFAINMFVYMATYGVYIRADKELDLILDDRRFIEVQGSMFASMVKREPASFSPAIRQLADNSNEAESRQMLGSLALRNPSFVSRATTFEFDGDDIAIAKWKEKFTKMIEVQNAHPSFTWGLSDQRPGWIQYLSYQFAHSGFTHLFWNMIFLLIFGCFVETKFGGSFVAITYVGAGLLGALAFVGMSGLSSSPLVGASAAVSGLMGLVAIASWKKNERLRFFFILLPTKPYYGFAYLPAWLILIVSALPDLSGYLASSSDFGSVAYSAHLGGAAFGAVIALAFSYGWLVPDEDEETDLVT